MRLTVPARSWLGRPQLWAAFAAVWLVLLGGLAYVVRHVPSASARHEHLVALAPRTLAARGVQSDPPVDCALTPCMALTFDDGPNVHVTPQVLDILARHHVHATFFLIGLHAADNPVLVHRMYAEGHEIGNHTWSHRDLTTLSMQEVREEILKTQAVVTKAGVPMPTLFRPPYGEVDQVVRSHVPLSIIMWNVDPEDWKTKDPQKIVDHVIAHAKPGAIVDLHDIRQPTADALDPILVNLQQQYHLVTVSQLLDLPAGQPGIFYGR